MLVTEKGTLKSKGEVRRGTSSNGEWKSQEAIIEIKEENNGKEYVRAICVEGFNKSVDALTFFKEGDKVEVTYTPRSREYNGRWFTGLSLVSVKADETAKVEKEEKPKSSPKSATPKPSPIDLSKGADDDLPF